MEERRTDMETMDHDGKKDHVGGATAFPKNEPAKRTGVRRCERR